MQTSFRANRLLPLLFPAVLVVACSDGAAQHAESNESTTQAVGPVQSVGIIHSGLGIAVGPKYPDPSTRMSSSIAPTVRPDCRLGEKYDHPFLTDMAKWGYDCSYAQAYNTAPNTVTPGYTLCVDTPELRSHLANMTVVQPANVHVGYYPNLSDRCLPYAGSSPDGSQHYIYVFFDNMYPAFNEPLCTSGCSLVGAPPPI